MGYCILRCAEKKHANGILCEHLEVFPCANREARMFRQARWQELEKMESLQCKDENTAN